MSDGNVNKCVGCITVVTHTVFLLILCLCLFLKDYFLIPLRLRGASGPLDPFPLSPCFPCQSLRLQRRSLSPSSLFLSPSVLDQCSFSRCHFPARAVFASPSFSRASLIDTGFSRCHIVAQVVFYWSCQGADLSVFGGRKRNASRYETRRERDDQAAYESNLSRGQRGEGLVCC